MSYLGLEQGDIVDADMLFSDQVGVKRRPALIISNSEYNQKYSDIIVLKISGSKENPFPYNVDISQKDLAQGMLFKESTIMTDFPAALIKERIVKKVGRLSESKLAEVKQKLRQLYEV